MASVSRVPVHADRRCSLIFRKEDLPWERTTTWPDAARNTFEIRIIFFLNVAKGWRWIEQYVYYLFLNWQLKIWNFHRDSQPSTYLLILSLTNRGTKTVLVLRGLIIYFMFLNYVRTGAPLPFYHPGFMYVSSVFFYIWHLRTSMSLTFQ